MSDRIESHTFRGPTRCKDEAPTGVPAGLEYTMTRDEALAVLRQAVWMSTTHQVGHTHDMPARGTVRWFKDASGPAAEEESVSAGVIDHAHDMYPTGFRLINLGFDFDISLVAKWHPGDTEVLAEIISVEEMSEAFGISSEETQLRVYLVEQTINLLPSRSFVCPTMEIAVSRALDLTNTHRQSVGLPIVLDDEQYEDALREVQAALSAQDGAPNLQIAIREVPMQMYPEEQPATPDPEPRQTRRAGPR